MPFEIDRIEVCLESNVVGRRAEDLPFHGVERIEIGLFFFAFLTENDSR
jgi:hypothetical protein